MQILRSLQLILQRILSVLYLVKSQSVTIQPRWKRGRFCYVFKGMNNQRGVPSLYTTIESSQNTSLLGHLISNLDLQLKAVQKK